MKKILALILALMMLVSMAACTASTEPAAETTQTGETANAAETTEAASELAEIQEKGKLVVGITDFAPMDYQDENGEWIGFDADVAKAFAESLGVEVEFVEIDWDNKILELDGKTIDCVWNGMTLTDEVLSAMECSNAYCNNYQVVVLSKDAAEQYPDVASMQELNFAVESGSAGQAEAEKLGLTVTEVKDQATALMEVKAGTCDAAVIDALMAGAMVGEGTDYDSLTYTFGLNEEEGEQYGVGFRTGSDLAEALNTFFSENFDVLTAAAETYGIEAALIAQ